MAANSKDFWIEVKPAGYLKKFGNHKFFVSSPAEAMRAMFLQVKGFETAFKKADKMGLGFELITDKRSLTDIEQLRMGTPKVMRVVPRQAGKKRNNGLTQIFAAIVIAVVTFYTAGAGGAGAAGYFGASAGTVASIGYSVAVSLALGGITQMLTPQASGLKTSQDAENEASYAFGGPVNTTAQGQPVPVFYGYREVGGAVISASIFAEDQQ